ncbi:MAG: ABC transporter permease subunit [Chlorobiaceae bacterium]
MSPNRCSAADLLLPGAEHIAFDHHHSNLDQADVMAELIIRRGIQAFSERVQGKVFIPQARMDAEVGFSVENITVTFGGMEKLVEQLKSGRIRGIVNLVGCNNPKIVYEEAIVKVADELIAHDVLALTNGCAAYALLKLGFCLPEGLSCAGPGLNEALAPLQLPPVWHMGECLDNARASALFRNISTTSGLPLPSLPLAFSSPEWSNEKGIGASMGFRLLGLNSYHCIAPPIEGSEEVTRFFYEETADLLGAVMVVDPDPVALALGTAWIHLVAGEMLGADSGLGYLIIDARNFLRTDQIMAGMLLVGILGLLLNKLITIGEQVINKQWGINGQR